MKSEQQARNSRDLSDCKVMAVLEFYVGEDAEKVYEAIFDNQVEVNDLTDMLDDIKFTEKEA